MNSSPASYLRILIENQLFPSPLLKLKSAEHQLNHIQLLKLATQILQYFFRLIDDPGPTLLLTIVELLELLYQSLNHLIKE